MVWLSSNQPTDAEFETTFWGHYSPCANPLSRKYEINWSARYKILMKTPSHHNANSILRETEREKAYFHRHQTFFSNFHFGMDVLWAHSHYTCALHLKHRLLCFHVALEHVSILTFVWWKLYVCFYPDLLKMCSFLCVSLGKTVSRNFHMPTLKNRWKINVEARAFGVFHIKNCIRHNVAITSANKEKKEWVLRFETN